MSELRVKDCLRKTLGNARLTYEELLTVLVEVECTLNVRPMNYEYNEVDDEVLTPSHKKTQKITF